MTDTNATDGTESKPVENQTGSVKEVSEEKSTSRVGRPSILTTEQIEEVKKLKEEGMSASQITALTGIPHSLVYSQMYKEKKKEINRELYLKYKSEGKILSGLKKTNPEKYERRLLC
jgi:DNA invertase Pin-like site-specific DNA recombinase